jgi:hypothetical protein
VIADRLLARLQSLAGFRPTRWSLLRIAVFAAVGLVVASHLVPDDRGDLASNGYNKILHTKDSRVVSLPLGDSRGFRVDRQPGRFRIAWIGGSEIIGVDPKHRSVVPAMVNDRIRSVDGHRPTTDIYFLNAIRLTDELAALKSAVASKPDLVVVSLNPVWVLNDLATQEWDYLDGILVRDSLWPPSDWPVAASLLSPGDVGWRALSSVSRAIEDRLHWGTDLTGKTDGLSFLHTVKGGKEPAPTGLGELAGVRPVDFWAEHYVPPPKDPTVLEQQMTIFRRELDSSSGFNAHVLREMLATARRAGVDTYFYMPAINPQVYAEPGPRRLLTDLQHRLADVIRGQTSSRVVFDPDGLQARVPATPYQDIVHKLKPLPEVKVLTGDLCALLQRSGHTTDCEQP